MSETDPASKDKVIGDLVGELSKISLVSKISQVQSKDETPTIYTLVRYVAEVDSVVVPWGEILDRHGSNLHSVGVKAGPVFCEGQFDEFVELARPKREVQVLYDSSHV